MDPERWRQVKQLFQEALERPSEARAAFLDEACSDDPELRAELESLLAAHRETKEFVDPEHLMLFPEADPTAESSLVGKLVGPYRVLRKLGYGGMGLVYLAVRDDQVFQKRVAVKLVKRGMDTDEIVRRFRHERQTLAALEHPNIARLLDGGTTDDGLPYFVMEYVEGIPIDTYCDTHRLTIEERLKLFQEVCSAVQYAHQNLVIHRDIKPANILVTSEGVPKLLDFGIAKIMNPELLLQSAPLTREAMHFMTPEYASPEQIRGEPITTVTDVYSLGVLLYELLTGHKPYRIATRSPTEIEKIICEQEPEKPSTAIQRVEEVPTDDGTTRQVTPETVCRTRGEQPDLGVLLGTRGDFEQAEPLHREAVTIMRKVYGDEHPETAYTMYNLAGVLDVHGKYDSSEALFRKTLEIRRKHLGEEHSLFILNMITLANTLWLKNDWEAAESTAHQAVALAKKALPQDHPYLAYGHVVFGQILTDLGQVGEAEAHLREGLRIRKLLLPEDHWLLASVESNLGYCLAAQGRYREAEHLLLKSLATLKANFGEAHEKSVLTLKRLAQLYDSWGKREKAREYRAAYAQATLR